jgi:hypothetical protein
MEAPRKGASASMITKGPRQGLARWVDGGKFAYVRTRMEAWEAAAQVLGAAARHVGLALGMQPGRDWKRHPWMATKVPVCRPRAQNNPQKCRYSSLKVGRCL